MSRMMVYAHFDQDSTLEETKFGDHFVSDDLTDDQAVADTVAYIRTQYPRRGRHFDNGRVLHQVWDVSAIAKKHKKFYKGSHIDDVIGETVGRRGTKQGKEFHSLNFVDFQYRINEYFKKNDQPLPVAGLAQWQYDQANAVIDAVKLGKRIILAELCARFGKTIWAGALAIETGAKVTVIASYVLTSFASFAKDLNQFEQFRNMEIIDSGDDNYKKQIKDALKEGRQVVVFLSMCGGSLRQDRIDFIFGLKENRLVFIDEADFGAHTDKQADPFIVAKKPQDVVVLMTGTNGERACGNWDVGGKEGYYIGTTYAELLMERAGV
jgi:hypothetical protein